MKENIILDCNIYNACRTNTMRAQVNGTHYDLALLAKISGAKFDDLIRDLQWCAENHETDSAILSVKNFAEALLSAYEIQEKSYKKKQNIEWRTGTPTESGIYLITLKEGHVDTSYWGECDGWEYREANIIAWCPIDNINPYKK